MMMYQVEFLIEGNLMPATLGQLRIGDRLLLQNAMSRGGHFGPRGEYKQHALGFVAVPTEGNFFKEAAELLDLFLLIYALRSGQPAVHFMGIGTDLIDVVSLGGHRSTWPEIEEVHALHPDVNHHLSKPIVSAKELFLKLEREKETILGGYLGLALRFYYCALQAFERGRLDETVIDLAVAGEAIVSTGGNFTQNFKTRLSKLIEENPSGRKETAKKLYELYHLRGSIVHGGGGQPLVSDVGIYADYMRRAIEYCLAHGFFAKEDLLSRLGAT